MLGPDFICIGMAKAGTGWLYDQTNKHPDFWMPPIKELAYLKGGERLCKNARALLEKAERKKRKNKAVERRMTPLDDTHMAFLRDAAALAGQPNTLSNYTALFRHKRELLSGDITPAYSRISGEIIAEVAAHLPQVRLVLLVREPVERLWSHLNMFWRTERLNPALLENPRRFRKVLQSKGMLEQGAFPTRIFSAWRSAAPQLALKVVLFDQIATAPEEARREILAFLGADPDKPSGVLSSSFNRKAGTEKLQMPVAIRQVLLELFGEEIRACAELFGGAAKGWPARYGLVP